MVLAELPSRRKKAIPFSVSIIRAALLVGTLDGLGAVINFLASGGKDPARVFQFIASGAFGKAAYTGSYTMILGGILFHFIISFLFTLTFFFLAGRVRWVRANRFSAGIFYGVFIWLVMTFLVLPFTKIPAGVIRLKPSVIGILILIVAIGLPLSYLASRYYSQRATT